MVLNFKIENLFVSHFFIVKEIFHKEKTHQEIQDELGTSDRLTNSYLINWVVYTSLLLQTSVYNSIHHNKQKGDLLELHHFIFGKIV